MSHHWILLRGLSRGSAHWGGFPDLLQEQGLEIELLDLPGNGTRYNEITPIDPIEVINSIRRLSRFSKAKITFNICAISLGGMIALKWAELFPEEIEHIVIINSSLSQLSPITHRISFKSLLKIIRGLTSKDSLLRESITLNLTVNNESVRDQYLLPFSQFSKEHPITTKNFFRQLYLATKIRITQTLNTPLTIVVSSQDHFVNPQCSHEMARYFKVTPIVNSIAGHDLPLESPQWLLKIIKTISQEK